MKIIDQLLPLLKQNRVEIESCWLNIGRILYNTDNGGSLGLETWIKITEQSKSHSVDECRALYSTFNLNNSMSIKTIAQYARQDSPEAYLAWHKRWCYPAMEKACSLNHTDVALALYRVYWLDFVYSNKRWYRFHNDTYQLLEDNISVEILLSGLRC